MPQNKFAIARYCIIDSLLSKQEYVKSIDIADTCRRKLMCNITQRTIQMDIDAMKNDTFLGYFAPIEYCQRRKAYYYREVDFQLYPLRFSAQEISLIQRLLVGMENAILEDDIQLLKTIAHKMKIFSY